MEGGGEAVLCQCKAPRELASSVSRARYYCWYEHNHHSSQVGLSDLSWEHPSESYNCCRTVSDLTSSWYSRRGQGRLAQRCNRLPEREWDGMVCGVEMRWDAMGWGGMDGMGWMGCGGLC